MMSFPRKSLYVVPPALFAAAMLLAGCGKKAEPPAPPAAEAPSATVTPLGIEPAAQALWVWQDGAITNATARTELLDTCEAGGITTLFFFMGNYADNQYNPSYRASLKELVGSVHDHGMRIHALRPTPMSPKLAYQKAHYVAVTYLRDFLKFNHQLEPRLRFDGLLLDVQPQTLPGWQENKDGVQQQFAGFVLEMRKTVIEFDQDLALGWAMPASMAGYDWAGQVYEYLNYVVLLDSRDDVDALAELAAPSMARAEEAGTRLILNLEVRDLAAQRPDWAAQTFYEEGVEGLHAASGALQKRFGKNAAFGGVAFQDYQAFTALLAAAKKP